MKIEFAMREARVAAWRRIDGFHGQSARRFSEEQYRDLACRTDRYRRASRAAGFTRADRGLIEGQVRGLVYSLRSWLYFLIQGRGTAGSRLSFAEQCDCKPAPQSI